MKTDSYLHDHFFPGVFKQPVLPATETLNLMARQIQQEVSDINIYRSFGAQLKKFVYLPPDVKASQDIPRLEVSFTEKENGCQARLLSKISANKATISRTVEHTSVCFGKRINTASFDLLEACALNGIGFQVSPDKLYADLVPFGPAFRNVREPCFLGREGAVARVAAPDFDGSVGPLGSIFPLDAAFHVACAWSQRYLGRVTFPTGYASRDILKPTRADQHYWCYVKPCIEPAPDMEEIAFDIGIFDLEGQLCEHVKNVIMEDIFRGKLNPPAWIQASTDSEYLTLTEDYQTELIEHRSLAPFNEKLFTPREHARYERLGFRRRPQYTAARIALKRLGKRVLPGTDSIAPDQIETVAEDMKRPECRLKDAPSGVHCSVSHDSRFAVAVTAAGPVGVDVESLNEKLLRCAKFYISVQEAPLLENSSLSEIETAARIWTIKEAVSKALDIKLPEAWCAVSCLKIKTNYSRCRVFDRETVASHHVIDDHVMSVVRIED